ncbi:MAG: FAD-dependent monooxygenase [Bacteroidia bacterium]|jgi:kynurenine 3-monooxygenase|nr:FAD-dependent monooxygenase [Bacteroidia bacterium]
MSTSKSATVIGAGLVGSLLSIYLAKRGYKVDVFERRADMRKGGAYAGRSINLALSDRGWRGLEGVGIADEIRKIGIPMYGRQIHHVDGSQVFQQYGKDGQAIWSVSRGGINMRLMDLAEAQPNVTMHFEQACEKVDLKNGESIFRHGDTQAETHHTSDLIFGSDGAFSAARLSMMLHNDRFEYRQFYIEHGYKELNIPAGPNGEFLLEKNALHIWPRKNYMMIALPNPDGSFTCTLFFPFEGEESFAALKTRDDVKAFFDRVFPDAVPLMPTLLDDYFANPTSSLVTVKCYPWTFADRLALIGDAAHAIVPFYGQGMNCGFEDCVVLNELIDKHAENWPDILAEYQHLRKPDGDAVADLALANFIEMRDKTADPKFLLQKKIEARFSAKYPDKWIPLYSMVTYSPHIRYSTALREGQRQEAIMQEVMSRFPDLEQRWDSDEVEQAILAKI